jgi:20S proteasome alpha/beta subunit
VYRRQFPPLKQRYPWPKEKRMTIAAGFGLREGILLCSDTQYTGDMKIQDHKIFGGDFGPGKIAITFAGPENYGKFAIQECMDAIGSKSDKSLRGVISAIRTTVKRIYEEYIDSRPEPERYDARFRLIIGLWHEVSGLHLLSSNSVIVKRETSWTCIGTGEYLARYLAEPVYNPLMTIPSAIVMATQMLSAIKKHDANCGGYSEITILKSDGTIQQDLGWNIAQAEKYLARYEKNVQDLRMYLASMDEDEDFFNRRVDSFGAALKKMRTEWKKILEDMESFRECFGQPQSIERPKREEQ